MRASVCTIAAGALVFASAPASARDVDFRIPPGPLGTAVVELGRQAGISIALIDPSLAGVRVAGVRGRMSPSAALSRMLAGTPARYVEVGSNSFRVVRRGRRSPPSGPTREAPAQRAPVLVEEEIIVTASKRRRDIRSYPGPVTVIRGDDLAISEAASGTAALASRIPALGSTHLGPGRNKLFVRGIADSSFNGPTQATVGQYFGEGRLNYNSPDPDLRLYDVQSVELLPGPQGTLYGAGAIGGVLRVTPNAPDPNEAYATVTGSASATQSGGPGGELAGVANLPIGPGQAAVRITAYGIREGGYIDDLARSKQDINSTRIAGGRVAFRIEQPSGWTIDALGIGQRIKGADGQYSEGHGPDLTRRSAIGQPFASRFSSVNLTARRSAETFDFVSTVTRASHVLSELFDASESRGEPRALLQRNRSTMTSFETRITRERDQGLSWLLGTAFVANHATLQRRVGSPGALAPRAGVRNRLSEHTAFGELTQTSGGIALSLGARVSHVDQKGDALDVADPSPGSATADKQLKFLPSAAVNLKATEDLQLYARYQEGFRPSGAVIRNDTAQRVESDQVTALEVGTRFGERSGSRLTGAASVSRSYWRDVQADVLDFDGMLSTLNIGDGTIWSLDGRIAWRASSSLNFNAAAVLNRSEVTDLRPGVINDPNAPLPNVPDVVARAGFDYSRGIGADRELQVTGWARYVGKSKLGAGPVLGRDQGDYFDSALDIRLRSSRLELFAVITNLTDARGNRFALGSIPRFNIEDQITPLRPRTIRLGFSKRL